MLNTTTKNRINTARDILVGKVPDPKSQVEQITIALLYKFMDDMDLESEELGGKRAFFIDGYSKYSWRKIFDPRLSGYELLNIYSEAIAKMDTNPGVPRLFREIFKNAYLPYRDPETLKSFLKIINEFEYSHSEKLGDAFEYLLSVLGSQGDAGQFRTPRHIIDFMVAIMDPQKNETILDPACGTAGFLISSYKHIIKQNSSNYNPDEDNKLGIADSKGVNEVIISSNGYSGEKLTAEERKQLADNIYGYDISPDMVRLSLVNMYLHGIKEPHISEYDTLTSEDNWHHYSDVILANPPFMSPKGGIRPHKRFSVQSNRSEVLFVDYIAEHLTANGRAAIIVPEGIIFQSGNAYKQLRKMLVEEYLVGVISLPAGVFQPYSGVKTSILWLDKTLSKKTDKIFFVKINNDGFDLGAQRRAVKGNDLPIVLKNISDFKNKLMDGRGLDNELDEHMQAISKAEISRDGVYSLSGDRYRAVEVRSIKYQNVTLGTVVDVLDSFRRPITQSNRIAGEYPYYGATGILDYVHEYIFSERLVLVGEDGAKWGPLEKSAFIAEGKYWVNNHAHVLRSHKEKCVDTFLVEILNFMDLKSFITGVTVPKLNQAKLKEIIIPLPSLSVQREIVSEIEYYRRIIDGARMVVENYKPRIEIDPEWEMVDLGDVCEIKAGGTPLKFNKEFWEGNIPWYSSGELNDTYTSDPKEFITEKGLRSSNASLFPKGSLLIGMYDTAAFKMSLLDREATFNQAVCGVKPNDEVDLYFLMLFFIMNKEEYLSHRVGVRQRNLNKGFISEIKIPKLPLEIQHKLVATIEKEQEFVYANKELIRIFEQKIKDRIAKVWGE